MDRILKQLESVHLKERRELFAPVEIEKDSSFIKDLFRNSRMYNAWDNVNFHTPYSRVKVGSSSEEYREVIEDFEHYLSAEVQKIVRVQNPFLYLQYELKLEQKKYRHGSVKEYHLYHGTKGCNVRSICRENFDWRELGASGFRPDKFGRGISFSPSSNYASDYPRRCNENPRVMFVASIMEVSRCKGKNGMLIPPLPHDTSADLKHNNVVVKYFDNEFYPEYIIYYNFY
ncbi:unnamed protein product [Phaedon cochleariae]|uniref:Poly [ADP-ribose] polymerase n=1 Tax=Phaedon cochleariae TaxID=80249 RepID=A0A9P0DGR0_PHACE|nr:unnamed protein product [Phaedon cochleariae]